MDDGVNTQPPGDEMPEESYAPLSSTADAEGEVGGEAHVSYGLFAVEGQMLTATIAWDKLDGADGLGEAGVNLAVSDDEQTFAEDSPVFQSAAGENAASTSGTVPRTGNYYISITAHPSSVKYRLRVTLE